MIFDLISYLEAIARASVYIAHTDNDPHFAIASGISEMEGLLSNLTASDKMQLIALSDQSGTFANTSDSNLYDAPYHQFIICKHIPEINDMVQHNIALKECKLLGRKIFAKMCKDQMTAADNPPTADTIGLRQLDQSSLRYFSVGPLADGYVGIQFSFVTGYQDCTVYDPEDWEIIS